MVNFLNAVAGYLINNHANDIKDIKVVFPNRRSGVFFFEEFKKLVKGKITWSPSITTINEFVSNFSELNLAEPVQLITELYLAHRKISQTFESFDDFYLWGEVLLADFNDVDKYRVNPESVFINVKNFKSIENQIDFLSDEQLAVLQRFFNAFDAEKSSKLKEEFVKIWEVMHPLYVLNRQELVKKGLGYEGMIYADALEQIAKLNTFNFSKIYFVGFNAITPIEEAIFEHFKNIKLADFFWDYDQYYIINKEMEAGLFQRRYLKKFPPVLLNKNFNNLKNKKIEVHASPTNHGQVFNLLQILNGVNLDNASDTAIILSDEQLLMPVINGLPDSIADVNITMGYPLSDTLTGNLIDLIVQLQQNSRIDKSSTASFYYKQVLALLRHPLIQVFSSTSFRESIDKISSQNLYYITCAELSDKTDLSFVFDKTESVEVFSSYLEHLLTKIQGAVYELIEVTTHLQLEGEFLFKVLTEVRKLNEQIVNYKLKLQLSTYFGILRKIIKGVTVPFEGEPILGLQIMGFLETRNLDFKNVIIMSVNEGMIPAQSRKTSFIPFSLRRGFGLPTSELNDAMYAYYFYRVLQSAENVWLSYNSGVSGMSTGEKSRLIYQLEFDENFIVIHKEISQPIELVSNKVIEIDKKGLVWDRLSEFLNGEYRKILSPSALSIYLQCGLRFYFRSIAKVREVDEVDELVDARLFGNIFHKAAEKIYEVFFKNSELVTSDALNAILKDDQYINKIILSSFSTIFFGEQTNREFRIEGKNQLVFDVIKQYLIKLLEKDKFYAPFSIVGLEKDVNSAFPFKVNNKEYSVILGGQVDRLDRSDKGLRIIDYKTGSDKLEFEYLEDVFSAEKIKDTKAIFQTFVYSYLIQKELGVEKAILPMVYQVKKLFDAGGSFAISTKKHTAFMSGNFYDIAQDVERYLENLLIELFDERIAFKQTENLMTCLHCPYKNMCGR